MSKKVLVSILLLLPIALFLPDILKLVKAKGTEKQIINPEFKDYIAGFTSGIISKESTIKIILANDFGGTFISNEPVQEELFDFSPNIEGKAFWINSRTIEFKPKDALEAGKTYKAEFHLSRLLKVKKELKTFEFTFQVMTQSFESSIEGLKPVNKNDLVWQRLSGTIFTADAAEPEHIERMLTVFQGESLKKVTWYHNEHKNSHRYVVDSIERKENEEFLILKFNANSIGAEKNIEQRIKIPSLSDFLITSINVIHSPEQYISVKFSDPLQEKQNLQGIITLGNLQDLKFLIELNEIRIYPPTRQLGKVTLTINPGIKNILAFPLKTIFSDQLTFEEIKPSVKMIGKGVILPNTNNLSVPFEAVNLKAVDITVVRIYENNIQQFLQVNKLTQKDEIKRVGRLILKRRMPLNLINKDDYSKWNRFSIDLSELIKTEPGAIYHITVGFRKEYSLYECADLKSSKEEITELNLMTPESSEGNEWDHYSYYSDDDYYDYEYDYDYNWNQRDNPCHGSYYTSDRSSSRNVLVSDLGLIAKGGSDGSLFIAVNNLLTTSPVTNASIEVYDFQNQRLATVNSDANGLAILKLKRKPFLLIAVHENQKGYLKLDEGSSLSLSQFDVSGESVQKGLKGFIYGERGVWRPGDSLYLTFILEDKLKSLPENHPIIFELTSPQGQLVYKTIKTEGKNGFYAFSTKTDANAPTGNYTARVKVGGATFTKTVKVETIMPNRLKMILDFGGNRLMAEDKNVKVNMKVKWLHGSPARNLKTNIVATVSSMKATFPKFQNFIFEDPARQITNEPINVFDGRTDASGNANFEADLGIGKEAPGMLMAKFNTKVFEEGGGFSIDQFSIPYSPFKTYVGIQAPKGEANNGLLTTDKNHLVQVVTVDDDGKTVSGKKLEVFVYKVNWRWWWQRDRNELADFFGRTEHEPVFKTAITTSDGKASFNVKIDYPQWGRYYVRVVDSEGGHSTGSILYIDWPEWRGRSKSDNESGATMLTLSADKETYQVGEQIKLNIPTGQSGRALVSVESGSKILNSWWVTATAGQTKFEIPATAEMTPNVFIYVTYVQPHAQTLNDLPIRMYGVIPIRVENKQTHLLPVIKMPEILAPEQNASITIKEHNGKAMTYTIAVVDEGLLDLTRFKTPDPWNHFYAKEALGIRTWDLYDDVLGAYAAKLERLLRIGGDESANGKTEAKANRFKPMVKFLGPYHLKKGEVKTHTFKMPQYIGSVRTMVIAGENGAYGFAEKAIPVRKPLMVLGTLPRVVSPGETVILPVTVFAMEKNIRDVQVEIQTNNFFSVFNGNKKRIEFKENGDKVVEFELKVSDKPGIGAVKIVATSADQRAEFPIEIDVRISNPRVVNVSEVTVDPGKSINLEYTPVGMAGTNKGMLEVSIVPPLNLSNRLKYLIEYPYGCIEQTTSAVFPQLVLNKVIELDAENKKIIDQNIKAGIRGLKTFQVSSGGLTYWPGNGNEDEWGTTYGGHFMILAEKKGYQLPPGFKDGWLRFQKQRSQAWYPGISQFNSDLIQSYRLYTLALAQSPELGAMNRLREAPNLSLNARWRLAGAYALAGQSDIAKSLISGASINISPYRELSNTYGTDERDKAMILEVLSLMGENSKAALVAKDISKVLSGDNWLSTQTTAYCLIAMSEFAGKHKGGGIDFNYAFNNQSSTSIQTQSSISQIKIKPADMKNGSVEIKNNTTSMMFVSIVMEGIPENGKETDAESSISMDIRYTDLKGNSILPDNLLQGTDFIAEVTLSNPGLRGIYEQLALSQIFPSGWEIHNARLFDSGSSMKSSHADYQDIRDDRVYTYFKLNPREKKTYRVQLNAAYVGKYYLPATSVEAMYDHTINARKKGRWIAVSKDIPVN